MDNASDSRIRQYLLMNSQQGSISIEAEKRCAEIFNVSLKDIRETVFNLGIMPMCYLRNMNTISVQEQHGLFKSSVAVIGCGGLGGYIVSHLARLGVGNIKIVDGDVFEEHNLNRQMFCGVDCIGKNKVDVIFNEVKNINPLTTIIPINERFNQSNCDEILKDVDVVADALDSIKTRLLLAKSCKRLGLPLVHGSIGGWYGQVSVQYPEDDNLISLFDGRDDKGIEQDLGNPSFTPALVSSIQVAEIIKILHGKRPTLRQKLLAIDLYDMRFNTLEF
ncbi:MAG: HesA/MoeB/ThiF family protein [Thermodesulfovibrionales bacterium]|nr:HesA/MoeB/ThiF family protein [Thermodesulfovibrionales bacterium]